jgi:hypothetical protein
MNEQPKSKHSRGNLNTNAGRRGRIGICAKRPAASRHMNEPSRSFALPDRRFRPARELMICLGWLRLFQAIVADGIPVSEESFAHEA